MNAAQQADLSAIRTVFESLSTSWARGDAVAYAALFTQDAQYTTNFGFTLQGRAQIEEGHRLMFSSSHRGEERVLQFGEEPQIRLVRPDVAIVLVGGGTSDGTNASARANSARSALSYVLLREATGWLISMFQNTRRTAMPGAEEWAARFAQAT